MNIDLKRALALKQFLNEEYFIMDDRAFEGRLEEARASFTESIEHDFDSYVVQYYTEIKEVSIYEYGKEYLAFTEEEAENRFEEELDRYLDRNIFSVLPSHYHQYFDDERWKEDKRKGIDVESLDSYKKQEHYETIDGEGFYIYKIN